LSRYQPFIGDSRSFNVEGEGEGEGEGRIQQIAGL